MKLRLCRGAFLLLLAAVSPAALSQDVPGSLAHPQEDTKLPNGKSQKDEILKAERDENIKDAGRLVEMAEGLKADLEKNDRFVLSMGTLKKTDDIEKLVKKIRARLRH
jgi:hypothetical protein